MDVISKISCVVPFKQMDIKLALDATLGVIQGPLNVRAYTVRILLASSILSVFFEV